MLEPQLKGSAHIGSGGEANSLCNYQHKVVSLLTKHEQSPWMRQQGHIFLAKLHVVSQVWDAFTCVPLLLTLVAILKLGCRILVRLYSLALGVGRRAGCIGLWLCGRPACVAAIVCACSILRRPCLTDLTCLGVCTLRDGGISALDWLRVVILGLKPSCRKQTSYVNRSERGGHG